jgi:hypothetical protein
VWIRVAKDHVQLGSLVFAVLNLEGSTTSINVLGVTNAVFSVRVFGYGGGPAVLVTFLQVFAGEF